MSRRRRIIIGLGGALLATLTALALALPTLAGTLLERKLNDALSRRELDASWSTLEVDWRGRLRFAQLKVVDPERGVEATLGEVIITPALGSILSGEPRIKRVSARQVRADAALEPWLKRPEPAAAPSPERAGGMSARVKRALIDHPPALSLDDIRVNVTYRGEPLASGELETLQVDADQGRWTTHARGALTPTWSKLPGFMRARRGWDAQVSLAPRQRELTATLRSDQERSPLLSLELPRVGALSVGHVSLDLALGQGEGEGEGEHVPNARRAVIHVGDLSARLGDADAIIASLSVADGSFDALRARPALQGRTLRVELSPSRRDKLGQLKHALRSPKEAVKDAVKDAVKERLRERLPLAQATSRRALADADQDQLIKQLTRLLDLLWKVDASIEDTSVALRLPGAEPEGASAGPGPDQVVTLARGLSLESTQGRVWMRGRSSQGSFEGHVAFLPGQLVPYQGTLRAQHVNIGELPGMAQGRTLPSRGIRGRLGGLVDLSAVFHGPLSQGSPSAIDRYTLTVSADWRDGLLELHGLSEEPLTGIQASGQTTLEWEPALARLRARDTTLRYGPAKAKVDLELLDWPLKPRLWAELAMDEIDCQRLLRAMPEAMTGPYRNAILEGSFAPRVKIKYPLHDPWKFEWQWSGLALDDDKPRWEEKTPPAERQWRCRVKQLRTLPAGRPEVATASGRKLNTVDVEWLKEPFVKRVTEGVSEEVELFVGPGMPDYVALSSLPPWVGGAAYLTEEILFYTNRGLNLALIAKAIRINLERGRFVYGGSTVTQQLVKNLFLTRDKTLSRKLQEALIAFRLDEAVSKDRLLELYINVIEFGKDLYGIEQAAQFYFQRPARKLTPLQAVFLANIKPSPQMGNRFKRKGSTPETGHFPERTETIFKRLVERELITAAQLEEARPFVLKWDAQGHYIEPKRGASTTSAPSLDDELPALLNP